MAKEKKKAVKPKMKSLEELEKKDKKTLIQMIKEHIRYIEKLEESVVSAEETRRDALDKVINQIRKTERADSAKQAAHDRLGTYKTAIEAVMATKYPGKCRSAIGYGSNDEYMTGEGKIELTGKEWEEINFLNHLHELASI